MIRKIIEINEEKCNGCGLCAEACHEGAIGMVNGKAKLLRDDYCDGLGDCLPVCPVDAIKFVEREAAAYDEAAVKMAQNIKKLMAGGGCAGSQVAAFERKEGAGCAGSQAAAFDRDEAAGAGGPVQSQIMNWPVQIRLAPVNAPYFDGADLLIAADCTAFAYGDFHNRFVKGHIMLVGCPKLDPVDYSEKLTEILKNNDIKSVTLVRMQVPCCGGLQAATAKAIKDCGKEIPAQMAVISTDGRLISE